tara:strand:- start:284 stop:508 length:225 start_codon:yes stop_codon:yes gene_type:complete
MDDKIFNFGDLVKLSPWGEATFANNPVGQRYLGQNGIIVSEVMEKLNMTGYKVKFAAESTVFLGIDEITLVKGC